MVPALIKKLGSSFSWLQILAAVVLSLAVYRSISEIAGSIAGHSYYQNETLFLNKATYASGEPMTTRAMVNRNVPENCYIEVERWILDESGVVWWSQIIPGVAKNGDGQVIRRTVNPPQLLPGKYRFRSQATNFCSESIIRSDPVEVAFEIR